MQIDRVDPCYLGRSSRVDVSEETRIKATSDEAIEWAREVQAVAGTSFACLKFTSKIYTQIGPAPNFISDIFYLTCAMNHYGLNRTLQSFEESYKQVDELQRHLDFLNQSLSTLQPNVCFLF